MRLPTDEVTETWPESGCQFLRKKLCGHLLEVILSMESVSGTFNPKGPNGGGGVLHSNAPTLHAVHNHGCNLFLAFFSSLTRSLVLSPSFFYFLSLDLSTASLALHWLPYVGARERNRETRLAETRGL